jgi:ABC-type nitrate/sulfonate/bicarbonate transport system permease component
VTAAIGLLALLGGWEALVRLGGVDPLLLPAPTQILEALWEDRALLAPDLWTTTYEVLLGLAAAIVAGGALAVAMHLSPALRRALRPLVIGSQAVPVPVIAPLVILVLGFGLAPKLLLVALVCFFPITINLYDGLRAADPDARKLLRSLQAGRWQALRLVEAPAALPAAFTGLKVAAAVAVIGAVFAEWAGAERGLGHALLTANAQLLNAARSLRRALFALAIAALRALRVLEPPARGLDPPPRTQPEDHDRVPSPCWPCLALGLGLAACGRRRMPGAAGPGARPLEKLTLVLDYFPNADHAGHLAARPPGSTARAGIDPPDPDAADPAAPLKLLQGPAVPTSPSPTSPSCCWRATRGPRT